MPQVSQPEHIYPPTHYKPARGGHAPGRLREALECWDGESLTVTTEEGQQASLRWLVGQLWNCTDIMPSTLCDDLAMPAGSTYAQAVRRIAQDYLD